VAKVVVVVVEVAKEEEVVVEVEVVPKVVGVALQRAVEVVVARWLLQVVEEHHISQGTLLKVTHRVIFSGLHGSDKGNK
jgi:hypothetical protein